MPFDVAEALVEEVRASSGLVREQRVGADRVGGQMDPVSIDVQDGGDARHGEGTPASSQRGKRECGRREDQERRDEIGEVSGRRADASLERVVRDRRPGADECRQRVRNS